MRKADCAARLVSSGFGDLYLGLSSRQTDIVD
jgi:hypothetical protein